MRSVSFCSFPHQCFLFAIMYPIWIQVLEIIIAILGLIKAIYVAIWTIHSFYVQNSDQVLTSTHVDWRASLGM